MEQAGALDVAAQRVRALALGLAASSHLWTVRRPNDPQRLLWLLGPGLRRVVTDEGTIDHLATAADRGLPAGVFSSAARRILRSGPARTTRSGPGLADPAVVLPTANRCPPPDASVETGMPLGELGVSDLPSRIRDVLQQA
jgi:hypothetical protein